MQYLQVGLFFMFKNYKRQVKDTRMSFIQLYDNKIWLKNRKIIGKCAFCRKMILQLPVTLERQGTNGQCFIFCSTRFIMHSMITTTITTIIITMTERTYGTSMKEGCVLAQLLCECKTLQHLKTFISRNQIMTFVRKTNESY